MKNFKSDHILELKDSFEDDDSIFMVLELCESDLEEYLFNKGEMLSEQEATEILKQLLLGFRVL
jgi:serine/threonine protein kinase